MKKDFLLTGLAVTGGLFFIALMLHIINSI